MSDYQRMANELSSALELSLPPIAVALCDAVPAGIPAFTGVVPAGCAFWEKAAKQTFITATKDHEMCAIGVYTHHLSKPSQTHPAELQEALEAMSGLDYVRKEEVTAIPVVQREVSYVAYGPLAQFPVRADVALVFAHARQGLILSEAAGRVDRGVPPAMGRPACAVVPQVLNHGCAAVSLGCCGARAYLDALSDSTALWAFPASKLDQYCREISVLARANRILGAFHARRREDVESGQRPSVRQSLARLSF